MKKKITAFLLLTCMLVGMIGNMTVYAGTSSQSAFDEFYFNFRMIDEYGDSKYNINVVSDDYKFIRVVNGSQQIAVVISKSSFTFSNKYITDWLTNDSYVDGRKSDTATCQTGNTDDAVIYMFNVVIGSDCTLTGPFFGTLDASNYNGSDLYQAYYEILCGNSPNGFEKDDTLFDEDTATYDKDLGYLQNLKLQVLARNTFDEINTMLVSGECSFRFKWNDTSSTGVSLLNDNVYVQLFTSANAVHSITNETTEQLIADVNLNYCNQYSARNLSFIIPVAEYFAPSNADYESWYNTLSWWSVHTDMVSRRDTAFLRLVCKNDDGTWSYGGYSRVTLGRDTGDVSVDSLTPDLVVDPDGPSGDVPVVKGSGPDDDSAADDAEGNDDSDSSDSSFDDIGDIFQSFFNGIKSLQNSIGKVPELIGQLFTAFPSSVIAAIGIGLVLAILLRILGR